MSCLMSIQCLVGLGHVFAIATNLDNVLEFNKLFTACSHSSMMASMS